MSSLFNLQQKGEKNAFFRPGHALKPSYARAFVMIKICDVSLWASTTATWTATTSTTTTTSTTWISFFAWIFFCHRLVPRTGSRIRPKKKSRYKKVESVGECSYLRWKWGLELLQKKLWQRSFHSFTKRACISALLSHAKKNYICLCLSCYVFLH